MGFEKKTASIYPIHVAGKQPVKVNSIYNTGNMNASNESCCVTNMCIYLHSSCSGAGSDGIRGKVATKPEPRILFVEGLRHIVRHQKLSGSANHLSVYYILPWKSHKDHVTKLLNVQQNRVLSRPPCHR